MDEGIAFWKNTFGYQQMTSMVVNTRQKVKVVFLQKTNSLTVKLIEPTEDNFILKNFVNQGNNRFHHICFKCDNLNESVSELQGKGLRLLVPPQPGEAFGNNSIAFLLATNSINIELIDTETKVNQIP